MVTAAELMQELDVLADPQSADHAQRFFKTAPGQYGEGDIFLGISVPVTRKVATKFRQLSLDQLEILLESPIHEHRLTAVIIMTEQAKRAAPEQQKALYDLYLRRTDRLNNWDIIDVSCRQVVGEYLMDKPRQPLYQLATSKNFWERRIAIVSTWQFIRAGQLQDTFAIAALLLTDTHDLIHKATGWMLREAGKRDQAQLKDFLDHHAGTMPRTALRYALERFSSADKAYYMNRQNFGVQ